MVPASFANFFLATAGAGGALIGLLFVAVSIDRERTFGRRAHPLRQGVASSAFSALVNAFFVSTWALLPYANIGYVALIVSVACILDTGRFCMDLFRRRAHLRLRSAGRLGLARLVAIVAPSLALYGYECVLAALLIQRPHTVDFIYALGGVVLGVYAQGLARAWELLGAPRGLLMRLNPLNEQWGLDDESDADPDTANQMAGAPLQRVAPNPEERADERLSKEHRLPHERGRE